MASPEPIPYHPPRPPIEPHLRTSDGLLAAAQAILARPDDEIDGELRAQVCEKLWAAATRRLRVFADARRWYYCEHSIAHQLVNRINQALDLDPPELVERFDSAERLHREGFYEDLMDLDDIRIGCGACCPSAQRSTTPTAPCRSTWPRPTTSLTAARRDAAPKRPLTKSWWGARTPPSCTPSRGRDELESDDT